MSINNTKHKPFITIRELSPREGFQYIKTVIPTDIKVEFINYLSVSGLKHIEVTSFVSAGKVPTLADAEEVTQRITPNNEVTYHGLALNPKGFERLLQTGKLAPEPWIHTSPSETFLIKNINHDFQKLYASFPLWKSLLQSKALTLHGLMISCAFGCIYEGEISLRKLLHHVSSILDKLEILPREICFADTIGMAVPQAIEKCITAFRELYPQVKFSLHLHDTKGLGITNAYAGLMSGVTLFDASLGGLGGCPFTTGAAGNIATEELMLLIESSGFSHGINFDALMRSAHYLDSYLTENLSEIETKNSSRFFKSKFYNYWYRQLNK
jgi:hydroxymethylglutaryl-CoA lyase